MDTLRLIHAVIGERILPLLIVLTAIYLTIIWKPDAQSNPVARFFPVLIDIQVTLGLLYFVYLLFAGGGGRVLSFPFLLHPLIGFIAAGFGHAALKPGGPLRGLGRWSALVACLVLLVLVVINIVLGSRRFG